jgi:hypothetical protein
MVITRNKETAMLPLKTNSFAVATLALVTSLSVAQANAIGSSGSFGGSIYSVLPLANGQAYVAGRNLHAVPSHTAYAVRISPDHPEKVLPFFQGGFAGRVETSLSLPGPGHQMIFGGDFTSFNGEPGTAGLVRINADGSRDKSLDIGRGFDKTVNAIAETDDGSGDLWIAGVFTSYNGSPATGLVRISSTGKLVVAPDLTQFAAYQSSFVGNTILPTIDGSGGILVGGNTGIIKLTKTGAIDSNFSIPGVSGQGISISSLVRTDGGILLGGSIYYGGSPGLMKIKESGEVDPSFQLGHGFNGPVSRISVAPDDSQSIYVEGSFSTYDNVPVKGDLVRLNPNGLLDLAFNPPTNASFSSIQALPGGKIALYGMDTTVADSPNSYAGLLVLDSSGAALPVFQKPVAESDGFIDNLLLMPDGSFILGGTFTYYGVTTPLSTLIRLNEDGSVDSSFNFQGLGTIPYPTVPLLASFTNPNLFYVSDGGSIISFDSEGHQIAKTSANTFSFGLLLASLANGDIIDYSYNLQLLHGDLSAAKDFVPRVFDKTLKTKTTPETTGTIQSVAPTGDSDGSFWVAGDFRYYGKSETGSVVKLRPDGSEAGHLSKLGGSSQISGTPDRKLFWIATDVGQTVYLSVMDHNGSIKTTFKPALNCDGIYQHTLFQAIGDGSLLIGGSCGYQSTPLLKIHTDGSIDQTFSTHVIYDQSISSVVPVPGSTDFDIVGTFTNYDGKPRGGIARIHADGSVAN